MIVQARHLIIQISIKINLQIADINNTRKRELKILSPIAHLPTRKRSKYNRTKL